MESAGKGWHRFWQIVGVLVALSLAWSALYTLFAPTPWLRSLSDALCTAALLIGAATAVPILIEIGRSTWRFSRVRGREAVEKAMVEEAESRRRWMWVTFALAATSIALALLALVIGALVP